MLRSRLRRRQQATDVESPGLVEIDGGEVEPLQAWSGEEGIREVRHYSVRRPGKGRDRDVLAGSLLWAAGLIIAGSLIGAGYVAYEAQRLFSLAHNGGDITRAVITAALPDAGWTAMALVALVAALRGRSSARARVGVVLFFGLSLGAQVMYAEPTWSGYLVAIIPPIVMAWMLETFVVEVRRWAATRRGLDLDESPVLSSVMRLPQAGGRLALWAVRLGFDRRGTWSGVRDWVLDEAPLAPGRTAASLRAQAAIAAAGSTEAAAARAREEALAEAEQMKAEAAEQVRAAAEQAERRIAEAKRAAAERTKSAEASTAEQVEQLRQEMAAQVERARREAAAQTQRAEQDRAAAEARAAAEVDRLRMRLTDYEQNLSAASAAYRRLMEAVPARARLAELYTQLGERGDRRYLDRSAVAELARELYAAAGLTSEGTARTYLYEIVDAALAERGVLA